MNDILLKGVLRDIRPSHTTKDIDYDQAHLIVKNSNGEESVIDIVFKHFTNKYKEGDLISIVGNIRTHSQKLEDGKNRIHVYVFTYFDTLPDIEQENSGIFLGNYYQLSGRICKLGELRKFKSGKCNIQVTIANSLSNVNSSINSYVPCIAWGKLAKKLSHCSVGDEILAIGELRSREYVKNLGEDRSEIRVAHEALINTVYINDEIQEAIERSEEE